MSGYLNKVREATLRPPRVWSRVEFGGGVGEHVGSKRRPGLLDSIPNRMGSLGKVLS